MFSRNNNIFVDDLSVTKDNYLIAVLKMLVIFLVINYGTDVSYDHEICWAIYYITRCCTS